MNELESVVEPLDTSGIVVMQNAREGETLPSPPYNEKGEYYTYCMYCLNNTTIVYSDTAAGLLEVLIPNYSQMDDTTKTEARNILAQVESSLVQADVLFDMNVNKENITVEDWDFLTRPRDLSPIYRKEWNSKIPVILVDLAYQPYTDIIPPVGDNIYWIRPSSDDSLLSSLHDINTITLFKKS